MLGMDASLAYVSRSFLYYCLEFLNCKGPYPNPKSIVHKPVVVESLYSEKDITLTLGLLLKFDKILQRKKKVYPILVKYVKTK